MDNDYIVKIVDTILTTFGLNINKNYIHTVLYNFIPAFIFAPILLIKGIKYNDILLIIISIFLFIADLIHFINALRNINKKDELFLNY